MRPIAALLLSTLAAVALAADPVAVPAGKFADLKAPSPKGTSVVWRVYPPPVQRAPDLAPGRLIFAGKPGTTYVVTAITIDFAKQLVTEDDTEVTFAGKVTPDPTPDPSPDPRPKPDPEPVPAAKFYFLIVRANGPAAPEFTRAMGLSEWDAIRAAGHSVKDVTWLESVRLGADVPADRLPVVLTLSVSADGKSSKAVRPAVPLPTTGAGVLDLPKGVR